MVSPGDINQDVTGRTGSITWKLSVSGNMDFEPWSAREVVYEGEGVRFLLTHGHYHDVRATKRHLQEKARELGCSAALFGHTHIPYNNREKGILIFNPGSTAFPREGSKKSAGIIWVDERGVTAEVFSCKEAGKLTLSVEILSPCLVLQSETLKRFWELFLKIWLTKRNLYSRINFVVKKQATVRTL